MSGPLSVFVQPGSSQGVSQQSTAGSFSTPMGAWRAVMFQLLHQDVFLN